MSLLSENEMRIVKDWREAAITTSERIQYIRIVKFLDQCCGSSTWAIANNLLAKPCADVRKSLRRMEAMGYVVADSNSSNNIYWSLKP